MPKKLIVIILFTILGFGVLLYQFGFRLPANSLEGNITFYGTENKNGYLIMEEHNLFVLYEYQNNTITPIGTYQNIELHLLHDQLLEITKENNDSPYVFTLFDIDERKRQEISIDNELSYFLYYGGNVDVIDDNDEVIILYQELNTIVENTQHSIHFVYVVDKEANEVTKRYILNDIGDTTNITTSDILLENEHIIFISNKTTETEDVFYIDYQSDTITSSTESNQNMIHYLFDKHCLVTLDHRLNYTCRTIEAEYVDDVIEVLNGQTFYNNVLYDQEYIYFIYEDKIDTFAINGEFITSNEIQPSDLYLMFDDHEIMYIHEEIQQFILKRLVFRVVLIDAVDNVEIKESNHFVIKTN